MSRRKTGSEAKPSRTKRARAVAGQAGAAGGKAAAARAEDAALVAETMQRIRKTPAGGASSEWLKDTATKTAKSVGKNGKSGARGQLQGHVVEALDNKTYNAKGRLVGKTLTQRTGARNEAYDASRFIKNKFAGGVQQKSSAAGVDGAIARMERVKPGSAKRGTVRVPKDQVTKATKQARGRTRVAGMEFTSNKADKVVDRGLKDVARKGSKAGSRGRALAKGGAGAAILSAAVGGVSEAGALRSGRISGRDFAENRVLDASEGATSAVAGTMAAGATGTLVTGALGTSAGAAAGSALGAAGTSALATLGGMGTAGSAAATALGGVTVAGAAPIVIGGAASLGVGLLIGKGFKRVRRKVKDRQEQRRLASGTAIALEQVSADENGELITEAVVVELKGRCSFSDDDLAKIREQLGDLAHANGNRAAVLAKLRRRGFYLSDWASPGAPFGPHELDQLVAGGLIVVACH